MEANPHVARIEAAADSDLIRMESARKRTGSAWQSSEADVKTAHTVELIDASGLTPEPIRWLWPGWLARGKLHVLAGAPGTGKTTIALHIAACVSAARPLPTGSRPERGNVIIWSGEDDAADTLVPRLLAAGADMSCVRFVGDVRGNGERYPFDPARDVDKLATASAEIDNVALLIVDPLVSAVSGDSHKNAEVRRGLAPLVELAARLGAALIGITHYSKGTQGRDPLERVTGSVAFGALARIVFGTVQQDVGDDTSRSMMLARAKSNIGPDGGGFAYSFEQADVDGHSGLTASRIVWGAAVEGTARELLADLDSDGEHSEARDAADWLRELLAKGPLEVKAVKKHGDEAGFAWRTLQRAMRAAGVVSQRGGFGLPATWEIPSCATVAPVAPAKKVGANGNFGATASSGMNSRAAFSNGSSAEYRRLISIAQKEGVNRAHIDRLSEDDVAACAGLDDHIIANYVRGLRDDADAYSRASRGE